MGTRGLYGFYKDGITKATYNNYDSYPSYLGNHIARFVQNTPIGELNQIFDRIILVNERSKPTESQIIDCIKYVDTEVGTGRVDDWYNLLRGIQGELEPYRDDDLRYMIDSQEFIKDSLFCEYAYIINLDDNSLELYKGFNKEMDYNRYYDIRLDSDEYEYKNCKLVNTLPLEIVHEGMFDEG
jgi:hypothetical protein